MARLTGRPLVVLSAALFGSVGVASAQNDDPEAKFLTEAVRGDVAEVKLGELAQERGQSQGVREFGEMLVDDHSNALKKTAELAKDLNVIPPAQPSAEQMRKHDELARLSGEEFDREFAAEMVKGHQEEIAKYEKQAASGDSKVAKLAEDLLPTLKEHLAVAERLQTGGAEHSGRSHD